MKTPRKVASGSKSKSSSGNQNPLPADQGMNVFFHMVPDLLCVTSIDGYFKKLNPAWESVLGFTVEELLSRPLIEFIHPDDVTGMIKEVEDRMKGKETKFFINRHRCKDNSFKWLEWQAKANSDGTELFAIARDVTDRKKAEQALSESEEKYKAAFSTSPDAISISKMDGTFIDCNMGFTELTGYTREDVTGIQSLDLGIWVIPEDRKKLIEGLQKEGSVKNLESVFRCKDGALKTALMSASLIQINHEPHILSITQDITQRIIAEKALRESEEKYRLLAVNSSDVIWTMSLEGQLTYVSPSVSQLLGYTPEEVMLHGMDGSLTPESAVTARKILNESVQSLQSEKPLPKTTFILEMACKDGSTKWTELTVSRLFNDNQQLLGFVGTTRDITERITTEEKLKNSEEIFRTLAEYSPNMIFIIINNKIYYVNQVCEKKLGYTKQELYSPDFDFERLAAPEHKKLLEENLLLNTSGKELEPYEFLMTSKDDRELYTMVNTKPIQIGKENAILGVIMDISEQRWAEEILKKKANQFDHFSSLMVDRELKMADLKNEVNSLLEKLGEKAKYNILGNYSSKNEE